MPLRPILQGDESLRGILPLAEKAIAGQECRRVDALALCQIVLDVLDHSSVRGNDASGGVSTSAVMKPWSSTGRKPPGSLMNAKATA
jgi:hypothetical protein